MLFFQGSKIQAAFYETHFQKFKHIFHENGTYFITNPTVATLRSNAFKISEFDIKITFYWRTSVSLCTDFPSHLNGFDFVDYQTIINTRRPNKMSVGELLFISFFYSFYKIYNLFMNVLLIFFCIDILGQIVGVGSFQGDNDDTAKNRINIQLYKCSVCYIS